MKLKDILQIAFGAVGILAVFLPWYTVSYMGMSASANAFGDGVTAIGIVSILIVIGFIVWKLLTMFNVLNIKLSEQIFKIIDTVLGGLMVLAGLVAIIDINNKSMGMVSPSFGIFLLMIAGAAAVVVTWIKLDKTVGKAPKAKK